MTLSAWLTFFLACWAISISPGPGALSSLSAGLKYGFAYGYWNAIGLVLGILGQFAIVALGLGALLAASETAFTAVKYLGAAYLVYLGWRQFRSNAAPVTVDSGNIERAPVRKLITHALFVNLTNPKGTVFLLAVVPQFIDPARPLATQYLEMAGTMMFTDMVVMGVYTLLAAKVLGLLRKPSHLRAMNRIIGSLFIAAGVLLASFKRHA